MKRLLFLFILFGCEQRETPQPSFIFTEVQTDITPTVCGSKDATQIIEVNGTGLALFDYDNDGDLDVFVVNASDQPCRLYENISDGSIVFLDVTEDKKIDVKRWANGVAVGDVNGDGFEDLYLTCFGPNVLLMNNGGKSFTDITEQAGVGDARWGTSAAFGDLDNDGDLDLYVCNYLEFDSKNPPPRAKYKGTSVLGGPHGMIPESDIVYENMGDGAFSDATEAWQLDAPPAFSLNVVILDVDGDGMQDIYVGNDSMANFLFKNNGRNSGERFIQEGIHSGLAVNGDGSMQATMGIAIADVDGSGSPDFFTTNFSSDTNTLMLQMDNYFEDRTNLYGLGLLSRTLLGWSCGFHDFDLDGDEDLLVVNGHVYPEATANTMDSDLFQPMLWMSRVGKRFVKVEAQKNPKKYQDRAAVFGDLDGDGDTDVIVSQRNGPIRVLRNDAVGAEPLVIHLEGHALGAALKLTLDDGSVISRWNHSGGGFQSSVSTNPTFTFHTGRVPVKLDITWGNGNSQTCSVVPNSGDFIVTQID